jgi:hypothetical protein
VSVEDPGTAGLGGSDISTEGFRLAAGVTVGGPGGADNSIPAPPTPPPPPRMRLGHRPDGAPMSARPRADFSEIGRNWQLMSRPVAYLLLAIVCIIMGLLVALVGMFSSWGVHL